MTTRRDFMIALSGLLAAAAMPVKAIAKATGVALPPQVTGVNPGKIGDIVLKWDGSLWRIDCAYGGTWGLTPLCGADLIEGEEYSFLVHNGERWIHPITPSPRT